MCVYECVFIYLIVFCITENVISDFKDVSRTYPISHISHFPHYQLSTCAFYNWNRAAAIGTGPLSLENTVRKCFNCICGYPDAPPLSESDWSFSIVLKFAALRLAERAFCFGCLPAAVWTGRGAVCLPLLGWIDTQWGAEAGETLRKRRCK